MPATNISFTETVAVIGGGPAGMRAAETAAGSGVSVVLFEASPSLGRKLLVAGRGGLNITHDEPLELFASRYIGSSPAFWSALLAEFSPSDLREWAGQFGIETFTAGTGRVYPREMKAASLLRCWTKKLTSLGVQVRLRHRWLRYDPALRELVFDHNGDLVSVRPAAVVFALGGASWPETGSDGKWVGAFRTVGIGVSALEPANCGWELDWPAWLLEEVEGKPLKNVALFSEDACIAGELIITKYGLEGGPIYALGSQLRRSIEPMIELDLKPGVSVESLVSKLGTAKRNLVSEATIRWRLGDAGGALLRFVAEKAEADSGVQLSPLELAELCKHGRLQLKGPRPIAEAISCAGGVRWDELDDTLMLKQFPGVFAAGEMVDWEAPTGGYLLQACFSMGTRAGAAAAAFVRSHGP